MGSILESAVSCTGVLLPNYMGLCQHATYLQHWIESLFVSRNVNYVHIQQFQV